MPQYLAPGVYVEEISGPRTIAGVSTSTAAFVGPTRFGPTSGRPELLTSYLDYARIYGDAVDLNFTDSGVSPNYMALGVRGFFDEGGRSLYVVRTFSYSGATPSADHASGPAAAPAVTIRSRFPGAAGNMRVTLTLMVGNSVVVGTGASKALTRVHEFDTVYVKASAGSGVAVVARNATTQALELQGGPTLANADAVYPITVVVEVERPTVDGQGLASFGPRTVVGEFGFDPRALGTGISTVLTAVPPTRNQDLTVPVCLEGIDTLVAGQAANLHAGKIAVALIGQTVVDSAAVASTPPDKRQYQRILSGGKDGKPPTSSTYEGDPATFKDFQNQALQLPYNGLLAIEPVDDISIVAAPGAASGWKGATASASTITQAAQEINGEIVTHCERMLYRTGALDVPRGLLPTGALDFRNLRSSTHASLYYPWITVNHPVDNRRLDVPPSAYMCGIWARNDDTRGVIKAPANEVVRSAVDLEIRLNKAQQELLNPQGVNCVRFFPGPGFLVWGARTISEDPEWKYLSIRRYFNYLEKSIDEGTQWVVFEVNGPALWDRVRYTIEGFLLNEWRSGALLGEKPEQGFFVRCDASTMTPEDLDNGRLVCVIGVAAAKPAEFVIFRISQWTATASV